MFPQCQNLLASKLRWEIRNSRKMIDSAKLQNVHDGIVYRGSAQWKMSPKQSQILQANKFQFELKLWVMFNISKLHLFLSKLID